MEKEMKKLISTTFLLGYAVNCFAVDPPPDVSIDWTKNNTNIVSKDTKNYNQLSHYQGWGVNRRSDRNNNPILTYEVSESETNPNFVGPAGEEYGVETEFGFDPKNDFPNGYTAQAFHPRRPNTKTLRHYMDCGQTGLSETNDIDRSEIHIRTTLGKEGLDVAEFSSLWIGWSEYYTHLDESRQTTILQFRNQLAGKKMLEERGLYSEPYISYADGGPATEVTLDKGDDGKLHYHFGSFKGPPKKETRRLIPEQSKTLDWAVETGKWYDFVVQIIYRQPNSENAGRYRGWVYDTTDPTNDPSTYTINDQPSFDLYGPTMYDYPEVPAGNTNLPYSPELRWGIYRYNCKAKNLFPNGNKQAEITELNRYMTKYLGPIKMWKGHDDKGFRIVKPTNEPAPLPLDPQIKSMYYNSAITN